MILTGKHSETGALILLLFSVIPGLAGETGTGSIAGILRAVPAAELPARAASLVLRSDGREVQQTTVAVVQAAVHLHPGAAVAVVGWLAETSPAMAATAAATAASLAPEQAPALARAAAASAPAKTAAIVEAVCRVVPERFQLVGVAVAGQVPGAERDVLAGVAASIPRLKSAIEHAVAEYGDRPPLVGGVLARVADGDGSADLPPKLREAGEIRLAGFIGANQPHNVSQP